jgi:hypothetical protein
MGKYFTSITYFIQMEEKYEDANGILGMKCDLYIK